MLTRNRAHDNLKFLQFSYNFIQRNGPAARLTYSALERRRDTCEAEDENQSSTSSGTLNSYTSSRLSANLI